MAKQEKSTAEAPGAEAGDNLVEHVITQEDLDRNPELVEKGVQVGETVKIPAGVKLSDEQEQKDEAPEWMKSILDSNAAVIESNEEVLAELRSLNLGGKSEAVKEKPAKELKVNLKAKYVVSEGKSFRDSKDFSKEFTAGQEVSHLDEDRLKNLLIQGLIEEA